MTALILAGLLASAPEVGLRTEERGASLMAGEADGNAERRDLRRKHIFSAIGFSIGSVAGLAGGIYGIAVLGVPALSSASGAYGSDKTFVLVLGGIEAGLGAATIVLGIIFAIVAIQHLTEIHWVPYPEADEDRQAAASVRAPQLVASRLPALPPLSVQFTVARF